MGNNWKVLVVDDEPDVHLVTRIALRRRRLQGRRFELVHARSLAGAEQLLTRYGIDSFDLVVTDGVMETMTAGFELGQFIRRATGASVPVVLRSGIYSDVYVRKHCAGVFAAVLPKGQGSADDLYAAIGQGLADAGRSVPASAVA